MTTKPFANGPHVPGLEFVFRVTMYMGERMRFGTGATGLGRGYASVEDIDTAMRDGLGRRWAFMGPFETIDLNAPGGVAAFIERYGPAYAEIGRERPGREVWNTDLAETVVAARRAALPESDLPARRAWRDARLAKMAVEARSFDEKEM